CERQVRQTWGTSGVGGALCEAGLGHNFVLESSLSHGNNKYRASPFFDSLSQKQNLAWPSYRGSECSVLDLGLIAPGELGNR
ncbi:Uncharacterized protein DAT39_003256, partial [Clarias magur]